MTKFQEFFIIFHIFLYRRIQLKNEAKIKKKGMGLIMFVCNIKLSKTKFFKCVLGIMAIFCIALVGMGISKIYHANENFEIFSRDGDCMPSGDVAYLTDENYTNILKQVHENLDTYLGQKICYTGYVYRVDDLPEDQFILARDMRNFQYQSNCDCRLFV